MKIVDETMFVAVYGSIQLHPWNQGKDLIEDAYSLFYSRSNAMGWLSEVKDVIGRVGKLRLDGLQLLVPSQAGGVPRRELLSGQNWFATSRTESGVPVSVTLDAGESPAVQERVESIAETLSGLAAGVFSPGHYSTDHAMAVELVPPVVGGDWVGDGHRPVTFTGTLSEWSFDALGWTASLFAEACHRDRVHTTVLMSLGAPGTSVDVGSPDWVPIRPGRRVPTR